MAKFKSGMSSEDWALAILVVIIVVVALFVVSIVGELAAKIATGAIGLGGSIVLAVLKHGMEAARTRRDALWLEKQRNYKKLLENIGGFVRSNCKNYDPLTISHIESWVFGDSEVVMKTNAFMQNPNPESLIDLLQCMRASIGPPELESLDMNSYKTVVLFPKSEGHF